MQFHEKSMIFSESKGIILIARVGLVTFSIVIVPFVILVMSTGTMGSENKIKTWPISLIFEIDGITEPFFC